MYSKNIKASYGITTFTCSSSKLGNNLIKRTMSSKLSCFILTAKLLTLRTIVVGLSTINPLTEHGIQN